jgi:signal peptidase I
VYWVTFGLLCAAVVALVVGFFVTFRAAQVPSSSMAPTIQPGNVVSYQPGASGIVRGDVVLVQLPNIGGNVLFVKRVIGLPGDRVTCCDSAGRITINGTVITEDYLPPGAASSQVGFKVTVPQGRIWVMGDNRPDSADSRIWGPLAMSSIQGRAIMVSRPGGRTLLRTPATFTANGLAPADDRTPLPFVLLGFGLFGIVAVIVQGVAGIIMWSVRRRRARRQLPPQVAW